MVPLPEKEAADGRGRGTLVCEPAVHRRLKLGLRDASEADRWAEKVLRISLVYADDGKPLQSGSALAGAREEPIMHWAVAGKRNCKGRCVHEAEVKMDKNGETVDAFAFMASSNAHAKRTFELRIESVDGPTPVGRILVFPRFPQPPALTGPKRPRRALASDEDEDESDIDRELESASGAGDREGNFRSLNLADVEASEDGAGAGSQLQPVERDLEVTEAVFSEEALDSTMAVIERLSGLQLDVVEGAGPDERALPAAYERWLSRALNKASAAPVHGDEVAWRMLPEPMRSGKGPPPVPLLPDLAVVEGSFAGFAAAMAADRSALRSPPASQRLVAALSNPLLLHTSLLQTLTGRATFRGALHNLREAGFYPVVGFIMEALAASILASNSPTANTPRQEAAAALELCEGLLTAATCEMAFTCRHSVLLPWRTSRSLLKLASDVARQEPDLLCRALFLRARTLYAYGYTGASVEVGFEAWSVAIRSQRTPSRLEAAIIELLVRALFSVGKFDDGLHLADRMYYLEGGAEGDRFLASRVLHMRAWIEGLIHKRPRAAMTPATQALEILSALPPAYHPYGSRTRGIRCVYYGSAGRVLALSNEYKRYLHDTAIPCAGDFWHPCWDILGDQVYKYLHPPEAAAAAARACGPPRRDVKMMRFSILGMGAIERKASTKPGASWLPITPLALYQLALAELVIGEYGKAAHVLERAGCLFEEKCPLHFPAGSPPQQAIAAALALARARLAGGPQAPDEGDVLGFRARALSQAALFEHAAGE